MHDSYINRIVPDESTMVKDLIQFFTDCFTGKDTKLLYLGTNFDRVSKEREDYIDDTEYETVDMDDMEVYNALSKYLPPPKDDGQQGSVAPEIDELDDEIFRKEGIIPVRDEGGKSLKDSTKS